MSYPNAEQHFTTEPGFSSEEKLQLHNKVARKLAGVALSAIGIVTLGSVLMTGHAGSEAVSYDLHAPVAATSYFNPRAGVANIAPASFEAGQESSSPANDTQRGSDLLSEIQRVDLPENEYDRNSAADTPSSEYGWRPDNRNL